MSNSIEIVKKVSSSLTRGSPSKSVAHMTGFMLYKMGQYVQESFERLFATMPIRARHFCVLRVLQSEGPRTQQNFCDGLWIDRATMVAVIQDLLELGFVRKRPHPEDRRCHLIELSPKGEKFYAANVRAFEELEGNLFPSLNAAEQKALKNILVKMMNEQCAVSVTGQSRRNDETVQL